MFSLLRKSLWTRGGLWSEVSLRPAFWPNLWIVLLLLVASLGTAFQCDSSDEGSESVINIVLSQDDEEITEIVLESSGEDVKINITVEGTTSSWSIEERIEWLTATKEDERTLLVSYLGNLQNTSRQASAVLRAGLHAQTITITQKAFVPVISIEDPSVVVRASAGDTTLEISANVDWTVSEDVSWISAVEKLEDGTKCKITYDAHDQLTERTAALTLKAIAPYSALLNINFKQQGLVFTIDPSTVNVAQDPKDTLITLDTDFTSWTSTNDADWILSVAPQENGKKCLIRYAYYPFFASRTGTITLNTGDPHNQTLIITFIQSSNIPAPTFQIPSSISPVASNACLVSARRACYVRNVFLTNSEGTRFDWGVDSDELQVLNGSEGNIHQVYSNGGLTTLSARGPRTPSTEVSFFLTENTTGADRTFQIPIVCRYVLRRDPNNPLRFISAYESAIKATLTIVQRAKE